MNEQSEKRINPFFEPYNTPHDTAPFDRIRLEDYEEAFMEGIRRDNEQIEKTINNPSSISTMIPRAIMICWTVCPPFSSIC